MSGSDSAESRSSVARNDAPAVAGWSATRWFWLLLISTSLCRLLVAARLGPCYDEAYYHYLSLVPELSYFDHPPLAPWAMWLCGLVFGDSIWTIRFTALAAGIAFPLIGRALARSMFGEAAGNRAGMLLILVPVFAGNGILMTPDVLFALSWAASLWLAWKALQRAEGFSPWWLAAGLVAGLGMLSKYNMVLYFLGLAVLWFLLPAKRNALFVGALASGVEALLLFLPVLVWNGRHDWVSFRFQLSHGFSEDEGGVLANLESYVQGLLLIASPLFCVLSFMSAWRAWRSRELASRFNAGFFWVVVVFFGISSLRTSGEANWPMVAFFSGALLVARDWPLYAAWLRRATSGLLLATFAAGHAYLLLPATFALSWNGTSLDVPRMREFLNGPELARLVREWRDKTHADFICLSRHHWLGQLSYYAPELRPYLCLPVQGDVRFPWIDQRQWRGKSALLLSGTAEDWREKKLFGEVRELAVTNIVYKQTRKQEVRFCLGEAFTPAGPAIEAHGEPMRTSSQ